MRNALPKTLLDVREAGIPIFMVASVRLARLNLKTCFHLAEYFKLLVCKLYAVSCLERYLDAMLQKK